VPDEDSVLDPAAAGHSAASSDDWGAADRTWSGDEERALRLWIALARCYLTFARAMAGHVTDYGLTTSQFGVLEALHHLGPLPLGELAGKLLVTGGNVTYVMDRLEEQGLVARERSAEDRRVVRARLTAKGRGLVERVFPKHANTVTELAGHLGADEQEQLRNLLKHLGKGIVGPTDSA
jgi:MarR family 2-MHQ and catechol resistance regulon transcriptional repressor